MSLQVDLCGVVGNTGTPDGDGIYWKFDISDGWDSPEARIEFGEVTGRDGASLEQDAIGERRLVVDVSARVVSDEMAELAWNIIKSKLPPRRSTGPLVVYENVVKSLTVRRAARPRVKRWGNILVQGQLELAAIDYPFPRSTTVRTQTITAGSGPVNLVNDGDEVTAIKVTTTSSGIMKLQRTDTGQLMQARVSTASGTVFDSAERTVRTSAGALIFPMASPSVWFFIPAESVLPVTNVGTCNVSIQSYDAFA